MQATVSYPLCKEGEQIECKPGELLVAPGTKVNGTILFAQKAPDKYSRARLVLDFSNIVHSGKQLTPLYARVLEVNNARETVQNNEILGMIQPHASTKVSLALRALGAANPLACAVMDRKPATTPMPKASNASPEFMKRPPSRR